MYIVNLFIMFIVLLEPMEQSNKASIPVCIFISDDHREIYGQSPRFFFFRMVDQFSSFENYARLSKTR